MSATLRKRVEDAEAQLKQEIEQLWAKLKDPRVPQEEKKRIAETVERLENSLRAETGQMRQKSGTYRVK